MHPGGGIVTAEGHEVLPQNVKPTHYDLTIDSDLEAFEYRGKVVIDLDVLEDTRSISLNAAEFNITETLVHSEGKEVKIVPELAYNKDNQTSTTTLHETLPKGSKASITHVFNGVIGEQLAGFYRARYQATDGSYKFIATTQFEPIDARKAFPCFDEPNLKATFAVTLIADKGLTCLSNMDVKHEKEVTSQLTHKTSQAVTFNTSPRMSTYLLCFIIGEFNVIETNDFRVPIRVYATPDKNIEHGRFSLALAARALKFYETKFDSQFPLPKMDMVAIPDFSNGAMENWGLVTYRIVDLLLDEATSSSSTKTRVAEVVTHELAHQWFGNLVTMDFWEGLWLNEGFATWMASYSCNDFFPEWKIWQNFITNDYSSALGLDSLRSSHPVEVPLKAAREVDQVFDAISYSKGCCVLRMVSRYIGEETFLEGVRQYIAKHQYGNTHTDDLWAALADASGQDVKKIMNIWTRYIGYPVVTVSEQGDRVFLKQNRYLKTADVKADEDEVLYPISIGVRTESGLTDYMFDTREKKLPIDPAKFYKLNADHTGFFRTSYPTDRLEKLGESAHNSDLLTVEDRAGLILDAGALSASGNQKTSALFALLKGFENESNAVVWGAIATNWVTVRGAWLFEDDDVQAGLKKFGSQLFGKKAREVGWTIKESDSFSDRELKTLLFSQAGQNGDKAVIKAAFDMFEDFAAGNREAIHPELRSPVFRLVLANGGKKEYEALLHEFYTAPTNKEKDTALQLLGIAEQPELIQCSLKLPFSDEVRTGESFYPLIGLRSHKAGATAAWEWLQDNWVLLSTKYKDDIVIFQLILSVVVGTFTSTERLHEIERFFADKDTKPYAMRLAQSLDAVRAKAGWLSRDREAVKTWLGEQGYLDSKASKLA